MFLKSSKKNDASLSSKGDQLQLDRQEKLSHSSKSQVTQDTSLQSAKVVSKSKNLKGKDTQVNKGDKILPLTPKTTNVIDFEAIEVTHKRKKPSNSSDKSVEKPLDIVPLCRTASEPPASLHDAGIKY